SAVEGIQYYTARLGASAARTSPGRNRADHPRLESLSCHGSRDTTTAFSGTPRRSIWHYGTARGRAHGTHGSADTCGHHGRTLVRSRPLPPQRCTPATAEFRQSC